MARLVRWTLFAACVVAASGCAHRTVVAADLERVTRPAFVSRIEESGGPKARVFREDAKWAAALQRIEPREADRRLQLKLAKATTRFQVSDGLRSALLARMPREAPWTGLVPPGSVASVLESFLVEEVPANAPDYDLLRQVGADSVLELVVEDFGMRSEAGRAQVYIRGYGRLFFLGGPVVWFRPFERDQVTTTDVAPLEPFEVGKNPELYRDAFSGLISSVAEELAVDLKPKDAPAKESRSVQPSPTPASETSAPASSPASSGDETPVEKPARPPLPEDSL